MTAKRWQVASIIASFIIMWLVVNWKFSLIALTAIAWHENGHLYAARRRGYPTHGFFFFPFIGGISFYGGGQKTSLTDRSYIALAGPISGYVLSFILFGIGKIFNSDFCIAASMLNVIINLFNLFPLGALDGGLVVSSILQSTNNTATKIFYWTSFIASCIVAATLKSPVFWLLVLLSAIDVYAISMSNTVIPQKYKMNNVTIASSIILYFSIIGALIFLLHALPGISVLEMELGL